MTADERTYLEARADQHRRQARAARDPVQRALHERFAALYAARAAGRPVHDH